MSQYDGSQFDIKTGTDLRGPATAALRTYDVREQDGQIGSDLSFFILARAASGKEPCPG